MLGIEVVLCISGLDDHDEPPGVGPDAGWHGVLPAAGGRRHLSFSSHRGALLRLQALEEDEAR